MTIVGSIWASARSIERASQMSSAARPTAQAFTSGQAGAASTSPRAICPCQPAIKRRMGSSLFQLQGENMTRRARVRAWR